MHAQALKHATCPLPQELPSPGPSLLIGRIHWAMVQLTKHFFVVLIYLSAIVSFVFLSKRVLRELLKFGVSFPLVKHAELVIKKALKMTARGICQKYLQLVHVLVHAEMMYVCRGVCIHEEAEGPADFVGDDGTCLQSSNGYWGGESGSDVERAAFKDIPITTLRLYELDVVPAVVIVIEGGVDRPASV
jgi:hypothetical protein